MESNTSLYNIDEKMVVELKSGIEGVKTIDLENKVSNLTRKRISLHKFSNEKSTYIFYYK